MMIALVQKDMNMHEKHLLQKVMNMHEKQLDALLVERSVRQHSSELHYNTQNQIKCQARTLLA